MKAFYESHKKELFLVMPFLALVVIVFMIHTSHRVTHFQECDSTIVYEALRNFPLTSLSFNSYVSNGSFISADRAQSILALPPAQALMSFYRDRYHVADEKEFSARVIRALVRLNPITAFRAAYIAVLSQIPAPFFIKSFFALPTATTYSPGAGLLFGLLGTSATSYESFMSRSTLVTLILFAASVLMLFFISRRVGARFLVASIVGTMMLFSVSISSYAYHLGSTIFNVASAFVWIWFLVRYWNTPAFLKKMSRVTAVTLLFNYLIVVYWCALATLFIYEEIRKHGESLTLKNIFRKAVIFLKTQRLVIVALVMVGLCFYPLGESYRGDFFSVALLPTYIYDTILNFFGFYNRSDVLNIAQGILATALLLIVLRNIFFKKIEAASPRFAISRFAVALAGVYFSLVAAHVLAFFPSRHLLVFAPPIFILAALALEDIAERFRLSAIVLGALWTAVAIAGFVSFFSRIADTEDRFVITDVDASVQKMFIYDCASSLAYKNWNLGVSVEIMKPASFAPTENETYLYVSQVVPLDQAMDAIGRDKQHATARPNLQIISESYKTSGACFIGYRPDASCPYGVPNQIYKTQFKVLPQRQ